MKRALHADVPAEEILNRLRENSKDISPEEANWTSALLGDLTRHIVRGTIGTFVRQSFAFKPCWRR